MNARYSDFCGAVCARIRHATPEERKDVAKELSDHMTDHAEALEALGRAPEEAAEAAVAAMGDPAALGDALNQQYPLLWLVVSRAAAVLIAVLVLQVFGCLNGLYLAAQNLRARLAPASGAYAQQDTAGLSPVDYRFCGPGGDMIYVYALGIAEIESRELREARALSADPDGTYYAVLGYCLYDRNPFGYTSSQLSGRLLLTNGAGEGRVRGSGGGNVGAWYETLTVPVEYGEGCLHLDYSACGFELHETVPLVWEGVA